MKKIAIKTKRSQQKCRKIATNRARRNRWMVTMVGVCVCGYQLHCVVVVIENWRVHRNWRTKQKKNLHVVVAAAVVVDVATKSTSCGDRKNIETVQIIAKNNKTKSVTTTERIEERWKDRPEYTKAPYYIRAATVTCCLIYRNNAEKKKCEISISDAKKDWIFGWKTNLNPTQRKIH